MLVRAFYRFYKGHDEFYRFYKGRDEFEEMSLDSKYNRIKEFNKFFISFKAVRREKKTEK